MGKIITINPSKIKLSQDFLKERTVKFILTCFFENKKDALPIIPIVRYEEGDDEYITIDGHNLIAVYDLFEEEMEIYMAENENDELTEKEFSSFSSESLVSRNNDLKEKFNDTKSEVDSFSKLREKYSYLKNINEAKEYYSKNREEFIKEFFPELNSEIKLK